LLTFYICALDELSTLLECSFATIFGMDLCTSSTFALTSWSFANSSTTIYHFDLSRVLVTLSLKKSAPCIYIVSRFLLPHVFGGA
jgi:hypothetical protein